MTSTDDPVITTSGGLTENDQEDLLDIGLFLLDNPNFTNMVVSPVGLVAVAGVIAEGTNSETVINLKRLQPAWTMWHKWAGPPTNKPKKNPVIATATQLLVHPDFSIKPAYREATAGWDVSIETGAITQEALDEWVRTNTANLIHQSGLAVTLDTRLALQNAITFAAKWRNDFTDGNTVNTIFTRADGTITRVDMMSSVRGAPYIAFDGWRGVRLDYNDGKLAAFILIPDEDMEQVTPTMLRQAVSQLCRPNETIGLVVAGLPRFTVTSENKLFELFAYIGLEKNTELTALTDPPTVLTQAVQQAIIVVDERGTVVSAVTSVIGETGPPEHSVKPIDIIADRPFYFIVGDAETGTPLFLSHIGDPTME